MIISVIVPVLASAGFTDCRRSTGRCTTGAIRFVKVGVAAVFTFMVMLPVFLRPCAYRFMIIYVIIPVLASAKVADRKLGTGGCTTVVLAEVVAYCSFPVFPFMVFFCAHFSLTAVIHLFVCGCRLRPNDSAGVIAVIH